MHLCSYDRKLTNLPQKSADLVGQNDTASYRKSEYDSCIYERKLTNLLQKSADLVGQNDTAAMALA
jgi:hypothetical protein